VEAFTAACVSGAAMAKTAMRKRTTRDSIERIACFSVVMYGAGSPSV
jgi:hypothetical protein